MFSPEETRIADQLSGSLELNESLSKRIGLSVQEAEAKLTKMVRRGLVWYEHAEGRHHQRAFNYR
jgi:predicted transcriptional regulator